MRTATVFERVTRTFGSSILDSYVPNVSDTDRLKTQRNVASKVLTMLCSSSSLIFCFSACFVSAVPVAQQGAISADYDAIVVGGGPAGLAALSSLARVRRRALLIDSAEYRNGPTRHMHDVAGFDGS